MRLQKAITPLLWRVIVFLCLFVVISGAAGPRIISGGILYHDDFAIYGGVGKAFIFGIIAFVLLMRHNKAAVSLRAWQPGLLGWIVASLVFFALAWSNISNLLAGERTFQNLAAAHIGLILSVVFAGIGCLGPNNLKLLWRSYKREIIESLTIAALFYIFLLVVYALWQPLAAIVLISVRGLLHISGLHAIFIPPRTLIFDKFGVNVAQYCSGIESIALFTSLYAIVGILDWERLNRSRYFTVFPIALLILFMLNILRIYGLILAGYYINPKIAFSLFHTYAGLLFFILYSAVFWAVAYKYLLNKPRKGGSL